MSADGRFLSPFAEDAAAVRRETALKVMYSEEIEILLKVIRQFLPDYGIPYSRNRLPSQDILTCKNVAEEVVHDLIDPAQFPCWSLIRVRYRRVFNTRQLGRFDLQSNTACEIPCWDCSPLDIIR